MTTWWRNAVGRVRHGKRLAADVCLLVWWLAVRLLDSELEPASGGWSRVLASNGVLQFESDRHVANFSVRDLLR